MAATLLTYRASYQHLRTWAGVRCIANSRRPPATRLATAGSWHGPAVRRRMACNGYVGQETSLASEYHSKDFDWAEHAAEVAHIVAHQHAASGHPSPSPDAGAAAAEATSPHRSHSSSPGSTASQLQAPVTGFEPSSTSPSVLGQPIGASSDHHHHQQQQKPDPDTASVEIAATTAACSGKADVENEWELFYRAHPRARFFKERRYLLLEFPVLAAGSGLQHVVEIGAGCGSAVLPVLRSHPAAMATVSDISATCLQQLQEAAELLGVGSSRLHAFVADGTDPSLGQQLSSCLADVALIMFTLSAVVPSAMPHMLRNALLSLRPGGVLCIRDHGLYDMVQLRIPPEQCIGQNLYRRGDGTLAYFFTPQGLSSMAAEAGFEVVECDWVCVYNKNRKTGQLLKRVFVHAMFRRPV